MLAGTGIGEGERMADWQRVTDGLGQGGHVVWESTIAAATGHAGRDHLPVFVALQPTDGMSLAGAINASLALKGVHYNRHEGDLFATERAVSGGGSPHQVRLVALCPRAMLGRLPPFWRVIEVGPPLVLPMMGDPAPGEDLRATQGDLDPSVPVAAVIDDGFACLNARCRAGQGHSRFRAVWLQVADALLAGDVVCGQV